MTPRLRIRRSRPSDLAVLVAIEHLGFAGPWSKGQLERELDLDWSTVLVAEGRGSEVVGFIVFWNIVGEVQVLDVAVHPDHRRRGVGRALLRRCLEIARAAGAPIALEVRRSNDAARALYASFGFREVGVRPGYYRPEGEDALLMEWSP